MLDTGLPGSEFDTPEVIHSNVIVHDIKHVYFCSQHSAEPGIG